DPYAGTLTMSDGTNSATVTLAHVNHVLDIMTASSLTVNTDDHNHLIHVGFGLAPNQNGVTTNTIRALDFRRIDDDGSQHDDNDMVGDPGDDTGDSSDDNHGADNAAELALNHTFIPFTFANKTNVTIDAGAGDDLFVLSVHHAATGLQSLTLNGGGG